jgi:hypothetical protein
MQRRHFRARPNRLSFHDRYLTVEAPMSEDGKVLSRRPLSEKRDSDRTRLQLRYEWEVVLFVLLASVSIVFPARAGSGGREGVTR